MLRIFYSISFILVLFSISYSQFTPISSLRYNNANGVPVDTGKIFTVSGIVSVANEFNSPSYMQDQSAGIAIYARGPGLFSTSVKIGDSVRVTGTLAHFNGLTQIYPTSFSRLDSLKTVDPLFLTIAEIKAQNWNAYEAYEGMLIRVNNLNIIGSGNWVSN
ncbi:MAG: hypothetical protein KJ666_17510, partial [Bacteroidetes bacterium]|nr:hypothetical protein [Bacteroidota bacterium]